MDLLAVVLVLAVVAILVTGFFSDRKKALPSGVGWTAQDIVTVALTVILVPVCVYFLFFHDGTTATQTQFASGFIGTCIGYWFKK
jgi:hypothetical protein